MASRKSSPDTEIRQLFELPLAQFTPARNALAKRLRQEKQTAAAKRVKALAKPTPSAWAVNLLLAREPEKMAELAAAGQRARVAQREAVSGRGAQALKDAIRAARALADELRWEAGKLAAEAGRAPSRTMVERIAANLQALAFDPEAKGLIARGWLERDLEPPGFEVLTGLVVAGAPVVDFAARRQARREAEEPEARAPQPAEAPAPAKPSAREKRQEEASRRREAKEATRREREAEARRRQVEAAEEKVEGARAEAASLREEAEKAQKAAAAAMRAAQAADRAAETAHEQAQQAAERLADAHRELGEVQKRG
jgi:hypothetical protein